MENNLGINLIAPKNAPLLAKIAILIYWVAALLNILFVMGDILVDKNTRYFISTLNAPVDFANQVVIYILAVGFAFAVLKLFLAFKLSTRKNWARIVVVGISTLLAAALIYQAYLSIVYTIPFLPVLKNTYWLVAEIVAASLLLLPKNRGWFAPKGASA